jgi:hypothetical protein
MVVEKSSSCKGQPHESDDDFIGKGAPQRKAATLIPVVRPRTQPAARTVRTTKSMARFHETPVLHRNGSRGRKFIAALAVRLTAILDRELTTKQSEILDGGKAPLRDIVGGNPSRLVDGIENRLASEVSELEVRHQPDETAACALDQRNATAFLLCIHQSSARHARLHPARFALLIRQEQAPGSPVSRPTGRPSLSQAQSSAEELKITCPRGRPSGRSPDSRPSAPRLS